MRSPQPPIPKPAKSSAPPESLGRPGYETPAISAGAAVARRARCPRRKLACFCSGPLAGFYFGVDTGREGTRGHIPDNGIVERLHKTMLNEFYRIAFRKKLYASIGELQDGLDEWIKSYNEERPHQGRWCFGKTPTQTFLDAIPIAREKTIAA